MIIDKLYERVKKVGNVCVGLDTSLDYIPVDFRKKFENIEDAIFHFNKKIIDATCDIVSCFKVQIAYYEAYGLKGLAAYKMTLDYLRKKNMIIIADIKRGDISKTAEMYAKAHFTGDFESDFITLNPYMGIDTLEPYLPYVEKKDKGVFVLLRTSNRGAQDFQYYENKEEKRLYHEVSEKVNNVAQRYLGNCGYSSIGGVVGATFEDQSLRKKLNNMFFLIPGYGAQGGTAKDVRRYLNDGNGGVVNSSRGILLAYKNFEDGEENFDIYARKAVQNMREALENE